MVMRRVRHAQGSAIQTGERCTHSRRNHRETLYRQGSVAPTGAATTGKRYTDRGALHPQEPQPCTHRRRNHREALYRQGSVAPTAAATTGKRYTDRGALHPQAPQPPGSAIQTGERCTHRCRNHMEAQGSTAKPQGRTATLPHRACKEWSRWMSPRP